VLAADRLLQAPGLYSTLLLWLLAELYERLPEVGDREKPKLVFFFDEAHLLFTDAPRALLDKIEQVVRLIRSKGVGVFFVTQNPLDIPDIVLGQLGNRVQHALRAFTPRDQKAVKAAAETMRANPAFSTEEVITQLGVGEALISFLDEKGRPGIVERAYVLPPASRIGPITPEERKQVMATSPVAGVYDRPIDRESAYERLKMRASASTAGATGAPADRGGFGDLVKDSLGGLLSGSARKDTLIEAMAKSAVRSIGSSVGREIVRGVLGSLLKGSSGRSR
jgi:DNA helicase HerA-like ATPase